MPKDKTYWKEYNQRRKAYLSQKKKEARERLKALSTTDQTPKVVDLNQASPVVDIPKVVDKKPKLVVDRSVVDIAQHKVVDTKLVVDMNPVVDQLTQLIKAWQTQTNYNCTATCAYSYCSNCWYFEKDSLLDYKEVAR